MTAWARSRRPWGAPSPGASRLSSPHRRLGSVERMTSAHRRVTTQGPALGSLAVTRPLKVGVQLPEVEWEVPFPELIAMAQTAEAVGFDSIWVGDHLLYDLPVGPRGPWEAWTTLAALAAVTSRVELGPLVAAVGFREPTMLAKQAATIDAISGGRFILGLGAGWHEREYRAYGFAYDHRVSRFAEAFSVIRALLREGRCDLA